jgi:hypothetical protein
MKNLFLPVLGVALLLAACGGGTAPQSGAPIAGPDTVAPTVILSAAQSGTTVNLNASASDNVAVSKVEFYRAGSLISTDTLAPFTATDTVSAANNGNVTYTAKAYDAAGNVGQGERTVAVNVTAPPPTGTLFQGVWAWGIGDPQSGGLLDSGAVVFNEQVVSAGRTVAAGSYANSAALNDTAGARLGFSVLGPISSAGQLETGFSLTTADDGRFYFVGADDDNRLELYEGDLTFSGTGNLVTSTNQAGPDILVALIQISDTVPTNATAHNVLSVQGKALAAGAVRAAFHSRTATSSEGDKNLLRAVRQMIPLHR